MTDIFVDPKRRDATCGCSGCGIDGAPHSDDYGTTRDGNGSKKRDPPLFAAAQRLFKQPRTSTASNHHPDDVVDVDLARAVSQLTFEEREKVLDELHGVAKIPVETAEFVASSLEALDRSIAIVPKNKRRAMDKAFFLRPSLASDSQFKLLFLRAEYFDATDAASRMIAYFETKRILFGDDKLAKKHVTLDDLSPGDIQSTFYSQYYAPKSEWQYIDSSGRPIIFNNVAAFDYDNYHAGTRGIWYMAMSHLLPNDDEETPTAGSIKGICSVLHIPPGSVLKCSLPNVIEGCHHAASLLADSLPFRFSSVHFCFNDPALRLPASIMQRALGKRALVRMRVHFGTPLEIRYALLQFGIRCPPNVIRIPQTTPTTINDVTDIDDYLERTRQMERHRESIQRDRESDSGIILYPHHPKDVLIGRGQTYKDHRGNHYHQDLVESHMEEYMAATHHFDKTCISMKVVQTIQDEGGRFLTLVKGKGWKILENSVARDKTSSSFRGKISSKQKTAAKLQGARK